MTSDASKIDRHNVLIVDDDPANLKYLGAVLKEKGYIIRPVLNGKDALYTAKASPPDIVLLDIGMPDMNGYEVCKHLKRNKKLKDIPVIFLTGLTDSADKARGFSAGGVDYITKPFDAIEVEARIKTHLTIVDQKKRLVESLEEKYRNIFDNAVEGIYQTTAKGRFLTANPAIAKTLGYETPQELINGVTDIATQLYRYPEDRGRLLEKLNQDEISTGNEIQFRQKNGTYIWVSLNARAIRDQNGTIVHYDGIAEDITKRRNLESQLVQAQKMEALGTMVGGIAHDFKNILTTIIGYGNLLTMKMAKNDPNKRYADRILLASEKAANLTQSLLAFSRKQKVELQPFKINDIIKGTEKLLKKLLTEDITFNIILANANTSVMANVTQFDQVLMNLTTNARDAMPRGGTLTIQTCKALLDSQFIESQGYGKPGDFVLVSVSDTGSGMDEETIQKIFEPFFTTKAVGKGTGLGLSTVYGIVKQHNGFIGVDSEPGKGTTFKLYFPVTSAQSVESKKFPLQKSKGGKETILLAEDNDELRQLLKEVLATGKYTVIEAADGDDIVRLFAKHKASIDLLLLDVVMPNRNGIDVFQEIRKTSPSIKALFISGYTADIVVDKGIEDDHCDFAYKPLSPDDLLLKVREILDR